MPIWVDVPYGDRLDSLDWSLRMVPARLCLEHSFRKKGRNVVKLTLRDRESVQEAVRRFRKLVERSGIKKEMRRREYYEKPSEVKRRSRLRAERRERRNRTLFGI